MREQTSSQQISPWYIEGIKEGRATLRKQGFENAPAELANIKSTLRHFAADSPVGQMLRGERDFWLHQIKQNAGKGSPA